ncbi:MAG: hypothetical protein IKD85_03685 [Firmicutes bacterium]|nr:hypothetical protein [Bacillota bacterium]
MACFIVPAAEAIAVTIAQKVESRKEYRMAAQNESNTNAEMMTESASKPFRIPFSRKLRWLSALLWGGSILLAFEHFWHGEIIPWFPFLSALADTEGTMGMLREMATVGVGMAVLITLVWGGICLAADRIASREQAEPAVKRIAA